MRSVLARFRRPYIAGLPEQLMLMNSTGDGSTLTLDFTTGVLDPRLTFTRDGGGTYTGNDGLVYGMDFATSSSLAIGTGSKSVTLTATAGVDRRYLVGQTVWISNGANNMRGQVTAYNASTQVLTINATGTSGSGSFTSWTVGNASARFDHDPTTLAPRGLLIEGSANNIVFRSQQLNTSPWLNAGTMTVSETGSGSPANDATSNVVTWTNGTAAGNAWLRQSVPVSAGSLVVGSAYTWSVWLKARGNQRVAFWAILQGASGNREIRVDFSVSPPTVTSVAATGWTAVQAPSIQEFPNGWYRVTTGGTIPASTTGVFFGFSNSDAVPASGTNGFEAWGYQLESGSGASSYIPTGASTGSRAADSCVMTGTNFSSWFAGATEGVLYAEVEQPRKINSPANDHGVVSTLYTSGTWLGIQMTATNQFPSSVVWPTGGFTFAGGIATRVPLVSKQAVRWFNGASITNFGNGTQGSTTVGTGSVSLGLLTIGANVSSGTTANLDWLNGCIRRVKFWPTALPNTTIQALTT